MDFHISSPAFEEMSLIPPKYTCDGEDISPPLHWEGAPAHMQTYALIVEDPDAPRKTWVHWVVYNIEAAAKGFSEGKISQKAIEGVNDFRNVGYGGPCPPSGTHRYVFTLYALDRYLDLPQGASKGELETAITPYIIGKAVLTGTYHH
jgi:Raf kinase inhibitor-like YbhB/YbcL family protein